VVLSRVGLPQNPAYSGLAVSHYDEQILCNESVRSQLVDDLHVREPLPIRADFVLALDDVDTAAAEDAPCLARSGEIQVEDSLMVLFVRPYPVVPIVRLVVLVLDVRRAARRVHVRWIKHYAVD